MRRKLQRRPSPSMAVSLLALVVAVCGTAVALPGKKVIDKNDLKQNVVGSKHIAPDAVGGADANEASFGQVPSAASAGTAMSATSAMQATNATQADGSFAFAHVNDPSGAADVNVIDADSKGITDAMVSEVGAANVVCFDLPFAFKGAQATVEHGSGAPAVFAHFAQGDPVDDCNSPHEDAVVAYIEHDGTTGPDASFFIAFYR